MSSTISSKQQVIVDRCVEIVKERAAAALASEPGAKNEYIEPYQLVTQLAEEGVISHPDQHLAANSSGTRERIRKSMEGKVRRALIAAADEGLLVRVSKLDGGLPRLDGHVRGMYGMATGFTTHELYAAAVEACDNERNRDRAERSRFASLVEAARQLGMPEPLGQNPYAVTYNGDQLDAIIKMIQGVK